MAISDICIFSIFASPTMVTKFCKIIFKIILLFATATIVLLTLVSCESYQYAHGTISLPMMSLNCVKSSPAKTHLIDYSLLKVYLLVFIRGLSSDYY